MKFLFNINNIKKKKSYKIFYMKNINLNKMKTSY